MQRCFDSTDDGIVTPHRRFNVHTRPLSGEERDGLRQRATEAEQAELAAQQKSRRWKVLLGAAVVIYALLWVVTVQQQLDRTKATVSTIASFSVVTGAAIWEWHARRQKIASIRRNWAESIAAAHAVEVTQIDVAPLRAWGGADGWIFELGDGFGLFAEWDIPQDEPKSAICWCRAGGGFHWVRQAGVPIPTSPMKVDWEAFPSEHPLALHFGPALFRLAGGDPIQDLLTFESGSFPLGEES